MPEKFVVNVLSARFHEQSIPVIESTSFLSFFVIDFFAKGSKTKVLLDVFFTFFANPNFTSFAAEHFFGSSCFNITT